MIDPAMSPKRLAQLLMDVSRYTLDQRERRRGSADPLSVEQVRAMQRHFSPELLAAVRVKRLINERLETPRFNLMGLEHMSQTAFTLMAAITFLDVIVADAVLTDDILFHELVHCEQYRQLGVRGFAEAYVKGAVGHGSYHGILLEEQAYMLGGRFASNPNEPFSVGAEVASWISECSF